MAVLNTHITFEIKGIDITGEIPDIIFGQSLKVDPTKFILVSTAIIFCLDNVPISQFVLQKDYEVFLEARPTPVIGASNASTSDTIADLNKWVSLINTFVKLPMFPQSKFEEEIERDDTEVKYKFRLGTDLLLDATWHKDIDTLDFGPRVQVIIPWADFANYVDALNKLSFVEIPNAKKTA